MWRKAGRTTARTPASDLVSPGGAFAVGPFRLGDSDADHEGVGVYVPAAQASQLLGGHGAVGAEVDHEAPADTDCVGEGVDLGDGGDTAFGGRLLACALDPARVAGDQVVVDCRLMDALEEAVRLGDGRLGLGGAETLGTPFADTGRGDFVQVERAEGREDVEPEKVLVQVLRADGQLPFLDPLLGVDTEVGLSGVGSAPVSSGEVCLYLGQPDFRVLLGLEGLVRADVLVVGPEVGRGPAAGAVLAIRQPAAGWCDGAGSAPPCGTG